jgi:serine/threonine-protein kinase
MNAGPISESRVILGTVLQGNGARYYIQEVIGEGGQGWVFKASYDDDEGFPVVVKVLRPDAATKDSLARFRREAAILQRLGQNNPSPYIVRYFDHGEASFPLPGSALPGEQATLPFTVLEYVHGEPLYAVLNRQRGAGIEIARARRILREVEKALEIVHAQGIVHRDLKPSNILLATEAGREVAKVTDFGLVKVVDLRHTATQSLAGVSLSYAPPEQYEPGNPRVGPPTDVFSFAAIVFEILSGTVAFPALVTNPFEALRLIATVKRPKLMDRMGSLPSGLRERPDLIQRLDLELERAMHAEPGGRPQAISHLWSVIEPILREASGKLGPEPTANVTAPTVLAMPGQLPREAYLTPVPGSGIASAPIVSGPVPSGAQRPASQGTARHTPAEANDPRAWTWRVLSAGTHGAGVRDAVFEDGLAGIATLGTAGLARWTPMGGFAVIPLGVGMHPSELRGLCRLPHGALAMCGERGLVAFLHQGPLWDVRTFPDPDVTFHAIGADASGARVLAVGERMSRNHAVAVEMTSAGWRRTFDLADLGPLRSISYFDGTIAFCCGDGGALIRIDDQGISRVAWDRTGHLRAIATQRSPRPRVVAVGTGGHALDVATTPPPLCSASIEKVMTTQDLLGTCIAEDGTAWASSANARVLRRDQAGVFRRVTGDLPYAGHFMRIAATRDRVMVLGEDAAVLEGVLRKP